MQYAVFKLMNGDEIIAKVIDESKQLRAENKTLMNTLTNRVGEMAMSS